MDIKLQVIAIIWTALCRSISTLKTAPMQQSIPLDLGLHAVKSLFESFLNDQSLDQKLRRR
jgi:hypothetical protein